MKVMQCKALGIAQVLQRLSLAAESLFCMRWTIWNVGPARTVVATEGAPCRQVRTQFRKIFTQMGFEEMPTNAYVESSFWNFDALFQPQQHPARDAHDTFFVTRACPAPSSHAHPVARRWQHRWLTASPAMQCRASGHTSLYSASRLP